MLVTDRALLRSDQWLDHKMWPPHFNSVSVSETMESSGIILQLVWFLSIFKEYFDDDFEETQQHVQKIFPNFLNIYPGVAIN